MTVSVRLPDGKTLSVGDADSALDVAGGISEGLMRAVVVAEVNGALVDAARPLADFATGDQPVDLRLVTDRDPEGLAVLRHSAAHIMAQAVMRLHDGVGLAFGPTTATGFYYDFDLKEPISESDFPAIEAEMKKIAGEKLAFERFDLPRDEAVELVGGMNQELKVEHINTGLAEHPTLGFYRQGEFVDLCRGPHIPTTGKLKAFKLMSVAGAHWKGDQSGRPLQRLYGTAFFDKKALKAYLSQVEEAKKRDHRVIGKRMDLFTISPEVGQGLVMWLPKGATLRYTLEAFLRDELIRRGYDPVYSPHIGSVKLYETSGHFPFYRESQFPPLYEHPAGPIVDKMVEQLRAGVPEDGPFMQEYELLNAAQKLGFDGEYEIGAGANDKRQMLEEWQAKTDRFLLKPMNCPHHAMMYKSRPRSYKQLPIRFAEFGTVYRHEQSGELNGLLRVRGLTQDDAHIFCTPEQVEHEFSETVDLVKLVLEAVGLNDYRVELSLRDPGSDKYIGSDEDWDAAEATLRSVLQKSGMEYVESPGEAAFYGPKLDFQVRDAIGREWQLGTVQLDYNLPKRFELEYIGSDNKPHRPVMIHRAPFGSMERFVGVLIEHFAGAFPLWLAPEQVRVLPLSEKSNDYAAEVTEKLKAAGFRATTDLQDAKLQAKIREAQLDLIPYMFVVGPQEAEAGAVAVRDRIDGDLGAMPLEEAIAKLKEEADARTIRQVAEKTDFEGFEAKSDVGGAY
ncbi:threonine--tRNA ligase [Alienimonas californiensis]|uniref:Threonine--tRNA ligase n=1 Tax=Alienimonas californiensis TaxID=2527989 RepID=A0A517PC68_9PLAN|nr:threonine--tRNA ligase [Alienimonas californiensis]QDT16977.1 Threonine--tRNA ligase [Alienimonas californiensis]